MRTYIISNTSGSYESVHTERAICLLFIQIKYSFKGYRVWAIPPAWFCIMFKVRWYKGRNITFQKYVKGSGQCTYWQPWMNIN
jgi:hypothetical protein